MVTANLDLCSLRMYTAVSDAKVRALLVCNGPQNVEAWILDQATRDHVFTRRLQGDERPFHQIVARGGTGAVCFRSVDDATAELNALFGTDWRVCPA